METKGFLQFSLILLLARSACLLEQDSITSDNIVIRVCQFMLQLNFKSMDKVMDQMSQIYIYTINALNPGDLKLTIVSQFPQTSQHRLFPDLRLKNKREETNKLTCVFQKADPLRNNLKHCFLFFFWSHCRVIWMLTFWGDCDITNRFRSPGNLLRNVFFI